MFDWSEKTVLVTGGTGTFGHEAARQLLELGVGKLLIYSRDELKQHEMRTGGFDDDSVRWFLGDVRDRHRLWRAMNGVDVVLHAAALKQIEAAEYNPSECVDTNVMGTRNVLDAALDRDVERVLVISSDKACDPATLYGATKAVAEKLTVAANAYAGAAGPLFAAVRYGNVLGSRGSVVPLWREQFRSRSRVTITDPDATRFWLTIAEGVRFTLDAVEWMQGEEVFVPWLGASTISQLALCVLPSDTVFTSVGLRAGEKRHELLVSANEAERTYVLAGGRGFVVMPQNYKQQAFEIPVASDFVYSSETARRLSADELAAMISPQMSAKSG